MEVDANLLNRIMDGVDNVNKTITNLSVDIAKINTKHEELPDKIESAINKHSLACINEKNKRNAGVIKAWKPIIMDSVKMVLASLIGLFGGNYLNKG